MSNEPGNRYNIQLINALVLYVGTQAIAHIHNKGSTPSMSTITHSAHMDIFQNLAVDLDTEGEMQNVFSLFFFFKYTSFGFSLHCDLLSSQVAICS